jgi:hypothetical protein
MNKYLCATLAAALLIGGMPPAQAAENEMTIAEACAVKDGYTESEAPQLFPWLRVEDHRRAVRDHGRVLAWFSYPEITVVGDDYPALARELRLRSAAEKQALEEWADETGKMAHELNPSTAYYEYSVVDRWGQIDDQIVSYALRNESYSGGAHPLHGIITVNLNPETGEEISIDDIVSGRDILLLALADVFRRQYPNREQELFEHDIDKALDDYHIAPNWQEYISWMLDARGDLVVFYSPYEIGPYSSGSFELTVTRERYPEVFRRSF